LHYFYKENHDFNFLFSGRFFLLSSRGRDKIHSPAHHIS
jgi:hypothetical protein